VGAMHSVWLVQDRLNCLFFHPVMKVLGIQITERDNEKRKKALQESGETPSLKVVAIGYGRTGTFSLTLGLQELGFPTLHTQHLYEMPSIFDMWTNDVFLPSIRSGVASLGKPDLDLIAREGFEATADLPTALYFEEIAEQFPECKFILTTRENSEVWFRSWDTLTKSITQPVRVGTFVPRVRKLGYYFRWLFSIINKDNSYLTVPFPLPFQNKQQAIASYEEHNRRVREKIPPHRLLEYNVKQGWKPLCDFLDISPDECPTHPFPKSNSIRSVQIQAISSIIFPLTVTMLIICSLFSVVFQKLTGKTVLQWLSGRLENLSSTGRGRCKTSKKGTGKKKKFCPVLMGGEILKTKGM